MHTKAAARLADLANTRYSVVIGVVYFSAYLIVTIINGYNI